MIFKGAKKRMRAIQALTSPGLPGWVLILLGLTGLLAPIVAPHDPFETNVMNRLKPPSEAYLFGTDALGRCILSRVMHGAGISLGMGVAIMGLSFLVGGTLGILAGYMGGWIDEIIMRLTDIVMAVPALVIALVLARSLGPGVLNMIWVVSVGMWPGIARMVRGLMIQVKHEHHIEVAVMTGLSTGYILRRHVLPAILPPLAVMATLGMGRIILMTSALGFLGIGIVAPTPDWGAMLNNGAAYLRSAPHVALFPGLILCLSVLCFNLLGEGVENAWPGAKSAGTTKRLWGRP